MKYIMVVSFLIAILVSTACTGLPEQNDLSTNQERASTPNTTSAPTPTATAEQVDSNSGAGSQESTSTATPMAAVEPMEGNADQGNIDMANPASVYCVDQGGELDIRDQTGGQVGYCIFPDGSQCEEWAYFRGECSPGGEGQAAMPNPASLYCIEQGGRMMLKTRGDGGAFGVCYFEDNRQCEEWALLRGDCPVGGRKITGYITEAAQYCAITGGEYTVTDESGPPEDEQGTCTFPNGTVCDVWEYYNGECNSGSGDSTASSDQSGAYMPMDDAACSDVAAAMEEAFTLDVTTDQSAFFDDYVSNETGAGCQATAVGNGYDFSSPAEASAIFGALLEARGWAQDPQYQADGPTGTSTAYRQGDALCLAHIGWQPSEDADCPPYKPIASCEFTPDQQLYLATLNCAQK
jgi:putative hemolysin